MLAPSDLLTDGYVGDVHNSHILYVHTYPHQVSGPLWRRPCSHPHKQVAVLAEQSDDRAEGEEVFEAELHTELLYCARGTARTLLYPVVVYLPTHLNICLKSNYMKII